MSHDFVCASCAGPVMEGRCATCRAAREQLQAQFPPLWLIAALLAVATVISLALTLHSH